MNNTSYHRGSFTDNNFDIVRNAPRSKSESVNKLLVATGSQNITPKSIKNPLKDNSFSRKNTKRSSSLSFMGRNYKLRPKKKNTSKPIRHESQEKNSNGISDAISIHPNFLLDESQKPSSSSGDRSMLQVPNNTKTLNKLKHKEYANSKNKSKNSKFRDIHDSIPKDLLDDNIIKLIEVYSQFCEKYSVTKFLDLEFQPVHRSLIPNVNELKQVVDGKKPQNSSYFN